MFSRLNSLKIEITGIRFLYGHLVKGPKTQAAVEASRGKAEQKRHKEVVIIELEIPQ
jgi:hypothetical protein